MRWHGMHTTALALAGGIAPDVGILHGAYTANGGAAERGRSAADLRVFALHYADWRPLAPVDNRPAAARAAGVGPVVRGGRLAPWLGVNGHLARARGGDAARAVYPGTGPAWFGYVELDVRR